MNAEYVYQTVEEVIIVIYRFLQKVTWSWNNISIVLNGSKLSILQDINNPVYPIVGDINVITMSYQCK
jgi:hypothetical protein